MSLHFLITDLETTGLDPDLDGVIEIAAVGTDRNLDVLFEYTTVIEPTPTQRSRLDTNPYLVDMHTENGLIADLDAGKSTSLRLAEAELLDLIGVHRGDESPTKIVLSGSGVSHFDQRRIEKFMPALTKRLAHCTVDVGVMRRAYHTFVGEDLTTINEAKTHRALDDVRCHLEELAAFRDLFRRHAYVY